MCMWAAPEHAFKCSCACPLHHELPHQVFKLYLIVQVAVSIHPARAKLSEATKRRSCDCYSSGTTVAMVTSGHADEDSICHCRHKPVQDHTAILYYTYYSHKCCTKRRHSISAATATKVCAHHMAAFNVGSLSSTTVKASSTNLERVEQWRALPA